MRVHYRERKAVERVGGRAAGRVHRDEFNALM